MIRVQCCESIAAMKNISRLCLLFVALLAIAAVPPAEAAKKKKKAEAPVHRATVIESIAPNSITVSGENGTKTYEITRFTEITLRGQRATLADLSAGMMVSVIMGTDPLKASRINASDSPASGKK